jgi:hypothetical protein
MSSLASIPAAALTFSSCSRAFSSCSLCLHTH